MRTTAPSFAFKSRAFKSGFKSEEKHRGRRAANPRPPQPSHDMDFRSDAFSVWLCSRAAAHGRRGASAAGGGGDLRTDSTMQSNGTFNGQCQGSQGNIAVDNTLRKKCSLWYRRSLKGCSDQHRQNADLLSRMSKVGECQVLGAGIHTHTHTRSSTSANEMKYNITPL